MAWDSPQWVRQFGTPENPDYASGVATDDNGDVYVSGWTFGPPPGENGEGDAWVVKYSAAGVLLWRKQPGATEDNDYASAVATDSGGNVYVSGYTVNSLSGGTDPENLGAWVAKYSAEGKLRWKGQPGKTERDVPRAVATDGEGNVYVAGRTGSSLEGDSQGEEDAWLVKYSVQGVLLWIRQLGTSASDSANDVATDGDGNVYVSGLTGGSLGGLDQGQGDAWVAKYSSPGALLWTRQLGTSTRDSANGVATDQHGDVYLSGSTGGSLGGPNQGQQDAWVAKYSPEGALLWTKQLGTSQGDFSDAVATDGKRNVYISGGTYGSLGAPQQGQGDAWVAKYSAAGKLRWKRKLGTSEEDVSRDVASDDDGNVYIVGYTNGSLARLNPTPPWSDAFMAKYFTRR